MIYGFMQNTKLSETRAIFLFDCQVVGLDLRTRRVYAKMLASFIHYAGDITVQELTPDHVRAYMADLSASPRNPKRLLARNYIVIRTWIRWLYAQKLITERSNKIAKFPPFRNLFPSSLRGAWQLPLRTIL